MHRTGAITRIIPYAGVLKTFTNRTYKTQTPGPWTQDNNKTNKTNRSLHTQPETSCFTTNCHDYPAAAPSLYHPNKTDSPNILLLVYLFTPIPFLCWKINKTLLSAFSSLWILSQPTAPAILTISTVNFSHVISLIIQGNTINLLASWETFLSNQKWITLWSRNHTGELNH